MNLCKKEQLKVLKLLLWIEPTFEQGLSILDLANVEIDVPRDDNERYLKMAIRLDPSDPSIYFWEKEY